MRKKLLQAGLIMGMAGTLHAQTVFEENFNDANINGWILALDSGEGMSTGPIAPFSQMAQIGFSTMALGATTYEVVNDAAVHIDDVDFTMGTPSFVLPEGDSHLSYRIGSLMIGGGEAHYSLYVLTAVDMTGINTEAQLSAMIAAKTPEMSGDLGNESEVVTYSLSNYTGQTIRIAWRLYDTEANALLLLDDVIVTQGALGSTGLSNTFFSIYPNPAGQIINIQTPGENINSVTVADLNGRIVIQRPFSNITTAQIDISGLSSGTYLVAITTDTGTTTKKIVKN